MIARRLTPGLLFLLGGCEPWARVPMPAPTSLPPAQEVELWIGRQPMLLREVVIEADTIRGRAAAGLRRSPESVTIARADVDSMRLVLPDGNNWAGIGFLGGFLAGALGMLVLFRNGGGT